MQLGGKESTSSADLLGAFKEMTDRVVKAVQEIVRPSSYPTPESHQYQNATPSPPAVGSTFPPMFPYVSEVPNPRFSQARCRGPYYSCGFTGHFARNCPYRGVTNDRYHPRDRGFVPEA